MNTFFRPCFSVLLILLFCISCLPTYGFAETFDSSLPVEQSNEIILQEQTDVLVNSITVSAEKTSLSVGETLLLSAIILPEDATNKALLWTSSDETVLTVAQNGMLTAIGPGIANVSASSTDGNDIKSDLEISVIESTDAGYPKQLGNEYSTDGAENKIAISSITVSAEKTCLSVGETLPLSATILPEDASNKALLWTSSDESVLTVDQNGTLTALGSGTSTVSASSTDGSNIESKLEISVTDADNFGELTAILTASSLSGTCGSNLTWTFNNGVLTISGTGAMETYYMKIPAPWDDLNNSISSVVIQEGVTSIGDFAFASYTTREDYTNLTSVTVPLSVTKIGFAAFAGCDNLNVTYYAGNQSQWNNIDFQEYNNPLTASTIHFSGETHTPTPLDIALQGSSVDYNNNLALIAGELSNAAYYGDSSVRDYLYNLGFEGHNMYSNNYENNGSLAYTVATRPYYGEDISGCTDILVIVARGSQTLYEFFQDIVTGSGEVINGYEAYDVVRDFYKDIFTGIEKIVESGKEYKVLVTGHSLGGAAANLVAAKLTTSYYGRSNVFCYTFGAIDSINTNGSVAYGYENIHNIFNFYDNFGQHGWQIISANGNSIYGKFGHIDFFFTDIDKGAFGSAQNHDLDAAYLPAVREGKVRENKEGYQKYVSFHCPVDVVIFKEEQLVGQIIDDTVNNVVTTIPITVVDGAKNIFLDDSTGYRFEITATDFGSMQYEVLEAATGVQIKNFNNVQLEPSKKMHSKIGGNVSDMGIGLYVLDDSGNPIRNIHEDGTETDIAHTHVWNDGTVTTSASCTATGVRTHICEVCGESKNDTIAALGHSYEGGICKTCGEKQPGFIPRLIEGNNGIALYDTNYTIKSNCSYSTFLAVYVDDIMLSPANYDAYEGSIVVVLKASYINSLAKGIHSIRIASTLGNADGTFTVAQGQQTSDSTYDGKIVPSNQIYYAGKNPPTGDSNDVNKWLLLTVTSLFCLTCLITYIRWYQKKH